MYVVVHAICNGCFPISSLISFRVEKLERQYFSCPNSFKVISTYLRELKAEIFKPFLCQHLNFDILFSHVFCH